MLTGTGRNALVVGARPCRILIRSPSFLLSLIRTQLMLPVRTPPEACPRSLHAVRGKTIPKSISAELSL